jgi:gluconolactonase
MEQDFHYRHIHAGAHISLKEFPTAWKIITTTLTTMSSIIPIDLLSAATNPLYFSNLVTTNISNPTTISLLAYNESFHSLMGENATARQLYNLDWPAFHEMGTYNKKTNSIYITSNYISLSNPINTTIIDLGKNYSLTSTRYPNLHAPNGGTSYYPPGSPGFPNGHNGTTTPSHLLFCDEGDLENYSSLVSIDPSTNTSTTILNSFLGRNFSSVNDVRQHPITGDIWFTDAQYGYFQAFRPQPDIPNQVYRFTPSTGEIAVVADGFDQSNGLEFSPDGKTLYVTDTGAQHFSPNATRPATIYAFDISSADQFKTLSNRRTFAYADTGFPDGIHADVEGNVWAACGDGVHVWSEGGTLLGKIWIGVESNNFAFLPGGVLVFSNEQLWVVEGVAVRGREICRDFGVCG